VSIDSKYIADIRKDYQLAELDESIVGDDPLAFFGKWFAEAEASKIVDVNAMSLATVDRDNAPHVRTVLLKGLEKEGFVFFTNYNSDKAKQLAENPKAALLFYWKELERQVRIEGTIHKVPEEVSDTYFHSRPVGSRIGAWASPQSQPIPNRDVLEKNYNQYQQQFGNEVPRPEHWGGYVLVPHTLEFWQGRSSRMHDRILFTDTDNGWQKVRLAP
jgi:pyridoxamine 5'-phosphate oxidase